MLVSGFWNVSLSFSFFSLCFVNEGEILFGCRNQMNNCQLSILLLRLLFTKLFLSLSLSLSLSSLIFLSFYQFFPLNFILFRYFGSFSFFLSSRILRSLFLLPLSRSDHRETRRKFSTQTVMRYSGFLSITTLSLTILLLYLTVNCLRVDVLTNHIHDGQVSLFSYILRFVVIFSLFSFFSKFFSEIF